MKLGSSGPEIKIGWGGDLLLSIFFLKAKVILTMKRAILFSSTTMTAIGMDFDVSLFVGVF